MSRDSPVAPMEADEFPLDQLRVVLVSPRNPLNIGAAARAMSNLGFTHLRLVNAYEVAYQEARSAVGAGSLLRNAKQYPTVAEAVADCSLVVATTAVNQRELRHPLRRLEYGGRLIRRHLAAAPAALLFGSEKYGLSNEDLAHCHWLLRIPTRRAHASMNLGQAVALCLYELARNPRARALKPVRAKTATAGDMERLTTILVEILTASGYVNPRTASSTETKVRRLVRRMNLSEKDAQAWLGMVRQIRWKLKLS